MLFRHRLLLLRSGVDSPRGCLGLKPLQMRVRKEIKTLLVCGSVAFTLLHTHQWLWLAKYVTKAQMNCKSQQGVFGLARLGPTSYWEERVLSYRKKKWKNGDISLSGKFKTLQLQMHAIQIVHIKYVKCNPPLTRTEQRATFWFIQISVIVTR